MARGSIPGLTLGQLVTLTFGFLAASLLIFAFGYWVGYDVAQQNAQREQEVVRLPAPPPPTEAATKTPPAASTLSPAATTAMTPHTTRTRAAAATVAPSIPTRRPTKPPTSTPTRAATPSPATSPAARTVDQVEEWTVQVAATTDPVQAVVLARRLREKGYDAHTATAKIGEVIWYRVRVGRFDDHTQAKIMEIRVKEEEGLDAAFVTER